ncbi:unnamed protein product [Urochloa humidicola]
MGFEEQSILLYHQQYISFINGGGCSTSLPDNTITDIANLTMLTTDGVDLLSGFPFQMPVHLSPTDRAARILRYKEERQARKYATRKAHAEARPRIKGRFAKRSDVELQVDHMSMFSPSDLPNSSYGTVPWF